MPNSYTMSFRRSQCCYVCVVRYPCSLKDFSPNFLCFLNFTSRVAIGHSTERTAGFQHDTNRLSKPGFEPRLQHVSTISRQIRYLINCHEYPTPSSLYGPELCA